MERMGSCVVSLTIEEVPITTVSLVDGLKPGMCRTDFDNDCQMLSRLHFCGDQCMFSTVAPSELDFAS